MYQYLPHLERAGMRAAIAPLLDDGYVQRLYSDDSRSTLRVSLAMLRRARLLLSIRRFDLLWIGDELFPWLPGLAEALVGRAGVPWVVDYDDAIFHRYDLDRRALVRVLLGRKIGRIMGRATAVVAGNAYLARHAAEAGARRVELLPSVVDVARYPLRPGTSAVAPPTIVWIGSPATTGYLREIAPALRQVCATTGARVRLIGAGDREPLDFAADRCPWREDTEGRDLAGADIGIMPLADGPWERGKCGYKIVQYMAAGLPVVASRVGANADIVVAGETGILVSSHDEWVAALGRLVADPALRRRWGEAGRRRAEEEYSLDVMAPRLISLFQSVAGRGAPRAGAAPSGPMPGGSPSFLPSRRKPPPA